MTMAKSIMHSAGKFISFISGPFIAFCPLCHFGAVILTAGQSTFLLAFAKILGPLILVLLAISIFSFYITYSQLHHNRLPLVFAILGAGGIIYIDYINNFAHPFFFIFGIISFLLATLIDFNLRFSHIPRLPKYTEKTQQGD